jgi:hypothetical protein
MKTKDFLALLRRSPHKSVIFVNDNGLTVRPGYHLTELKAATYDAIDCGAQKNRWNETIVQLWVPEEEASDELMTAGKFLSIYDKVSGMISIDPEAEMRFEYGDESFFPSNYHVATVKQDDATIRVELQPPQTTCKARDRRLAGVETGRGCC